MNTQILNFQVIIEQDEDGVFVASVPSIPGCYSQGDSYEKAVINIKDALQLCLDEANDNQEFSDKINFPDTKRATQFVGVTNIPMNVACSS